MCCLLRILFHLLDYDFHGEPPQPVRAAEIQSMEQDERSETEESETTYVSWLKKELTKLMLWH